jgi:hypothetical protein
MKKAITLLFLFAGVSVLPAQTRQIQYSYDENGNRESRYVVYLRTAPDGGNPFENIQNLDAFTEEDGIVAELDNARFTVFPNPTTSIIRTEWQMDGGDYVPLAEARLMGMDGKIISVFDHPVLPLEIDMRSQQTGMYILWIKPVNGKIRRVKIVKQ